MFYSCGDILRGSHWWGTCIIFPVQQQQHGRVSECKNRQTSGTVFTIFISIWLFDMLLFPCWQGRSKIRLISVAYVLLRKYGFFVWVLYRRGITDDRDLLTKEDLSLAYIIDWFNERMVHIKDIEFIINKIRLADTRTSITFAMFFFILRANL